MCACDVQVGLLIGRQINFFHVINLPFFISRFRCPARGPSQGPRPRARGLGPGPRPGPERAKNTMETALFRAGRAAWASGSEPRGRPDAAGPFHFSFTLIFIHFPFLSFRAYLAPGTFLALAPTETFSVNRNHGRPESNI